MYVHANLTFLSDSVLSSLIRNTEKSLIIDNLLIEENTISITSISQGFEHLDDLQYKERKKNYNYSIDFSLSLGRSGNVRLIVIIKNVLD